MWNTNYNVQMCKCANVQMCKCADVQMCKSRNMGQVMQMEGKGMCK